ncbi:MAG: hypothetical protein JOZ68_15590 [Acidimicrobiia bacterium]|nr:hypothetical protein [Acidimicrobiia bacterium]
MPVFLQLRLWLSQGPARERVAAGVAVAIAITLLILASLPMTDSGGGHGSTIASAGGEANGADVLGGATSANGATANGAGGTAGALGASGVNSGTASSTGAGSTGATSGSASARTAAAGPSCTGTLAASAPGITPTQVSVDVSYVDLAGPVGNAAFSIRPDQQQIIAAAADNINKTGGVACGRKIVVKSYAVNPIDQNDQQSKCLQMVQDKPFAVLDAAGYITPVSRACFWQNKLPLQISTSAGNTELGKGAPYLYGIIAPSEKQLRDAALGLAAQGFFAAPKFKKLGLLEDSCDPAANGELESSLAKAGVGSGQISKVVISCQLVAPPNEIQQAVITNRTAGATHVLLASSISNSQNYTTLAAQQNFHPVYATSDYGTDTANTGHWDASFVGALAITSNHYGELSSGIRNAQVNACDALLKAHGLTGINSEKNDETALQICDQFNFFRQALDTVGGNPTRQSFIDAGLDRMGLFHGSIMGDGNFDRPDKLVGGDFHRTIQFDGGCSCWKVKDPNFTPGF